MFSQEALQEYLLICCQYPSGGLIDKPGRYDIILLRYIVNTGGLIDKSGR